MANHLNSGLALGLLRDVYSVEEVSALLSGQSIYMENYDRPACPTCLSNKLVYKNLKLMRDTIFNGKVFCCGKCQYEWLDVSDPDVFLASLRKEIDDRNAQG